MARSIPERKPRLQGKIANLPEAQRQQVHAWMREGLIYSDIAKRVLETFGVSIAQSSLSTYHAKHGFEIQGSAPSPETLHLTLVLHVQIVPELLPPAAKSDGN
jgi:hypothetical protein